ncbi:hypothetical protein AVW11_03860 [Streptomyces amritsarensis]|uniref:Uncharacterized protein n=1 Tax=Streptomyces amritsarensis TaxID=681158 RepID=A0ABX3GCM1_9ACTN|nr:hypothetical protein [Streptomyces amritsarensis]OLZ72538.1 hypothetical protein AVW11_03860 [Streptomyces amritsarensis]
MSSGQYIRRYYGVAVRRGMEITFDGKPARIVGYRGQYLRVRTPEYTRPVSIHPTWHVVYPPLPEPATPRGWCNWCGEDRALNSDGTVRAHGFPGLWHGEVIPCQGAGEPPTHPVRHRTHPGQDTP